MASVEKFSAGAVRNQLRHNRREIEHSGNPDIDPSRQGQDYVLSPDRDMTEYDYFLHRKSELYCYNRDDVKVMAGWIVTAPQDLDPACYDDFFSASYDFMANRYGEENVVQAIVHDDEGGQPHLHFCFVPVVEDPKHEQGYKICANDVLDRRELQFSSRFAALLKRTRSGGCPRYDRCNEAAGRQPHCSAVESRTRAGISAGSRTPCAVFR